MNRVVLAMLLATVASVSGAQGTLRGAPGPFRVEETRRVAVRLGAPELELDLAALGARVGASIAATRPFGPRDMRLVELAAPVESSVARRRIVAALSREAGIEFATLVYTDSAGLPECPTPYIHVRFRAHVPDAVQRELLLGLAGVRIEAERYGEMDDVWRLASSARTGTQVLAEIELLASLPEVEWAESDAVMGVTLNAVIPNDPLFGECWGLHNTGQTVANVAGVADVDMDAPEAWDLTTGDPSVLVLVLDVGVQLDHPDLNLGPSADFTGSGTGGGPTAMCASHGTAVSGCVVGVINNGIGAVGVAPSCRVASASIAVDADCDGGHQALPSWFISALTWGEASGARVATSAVGPTGWSQALADKYDAVTQNGMIVFAASGNDPTASIGTPGSHPTVHAVGGIASDGSSVGTTGPELFCVAPAANVQTTALGGGYVISGGTSLAAPYAAGIAALLIARQPAITVEELVLALRGSCIDYGASGFDATFGYGMINARGALELADELFAGWVRVDWTLPMDQPALDLYETVGAGVSAVPAGGVVLVTAGSYGEALTITKALVLRNTDGVAVIGE